jgi:hypothetical protein
MPGRRALATRTTRDLLATTIVETRGSRVSSGIDRAVITTALPPPTTPAGLDDNAEGLAQLLKLLVEHGDSLRADAAALGTWLLVNAASVEVFAGAGPSTPATLWPSPDTAVATP